MPNYRDQSDGEDISLFLNIVMSWRQQHRYICWRKQHSEQSCDRELSGHWAMIELIAGDWAPHHTHLQAQIAYICWRCCSAAARARARGGCCGRSSVPRAPSRPEVNSKCQHRIFSFWFNQNPRFAPRAVEWVLLLYLFLIYVNDKNSFDWDLNGFSPDQGIVVTRYKKIFQYLPQ